ncbi:MAG: gene transfer agent family protein [Alphaproteobacteria bacterium]
MTNLHRGEISAMLDGRAHTLCLTLGALAELEERLGGKDILALAQRFETGRITAREAICVIGCGLRGGGNDIQDDQVANMQVEGGVPGYLALVIDLLQAAFGSDGQADTAPKENDGECTAPFPGGV